jgi:hypothetical protein
MELIAIDIPPCCQVIDNRRSLLELYVVESEAGPS